MAVKATIRDSGFTKRQIKIAAKREFNSVGFFATDTNKIAKVAGYAPGSFYRHFKDKIDVFIETYRDWHLEHMQEIERVLSVGGSIEEMSERLATVVVAFYGNWKTLRAAARVLVISEPRVAEFKQSRRILMSEAFANLRKRLHLKAMPEESVILFLILVERLGDAVSEGEFDRAHLPVGSDKKALVDLIARFLRGET
jgi:AcrR family transcriptional regulator